MSKENRGGTIHIDSEGKRTVLREPTVMVASGKKVAKSIIKTTGAKKSTKSKSEKK